MVMKKLSVLFVTLMFLLGITGVSFAAIPGGADDSTVSADKTIKHDESKESMKKSDEGKTKNKKKTSKKTNKKTGKKIKPKKKKATSVDTKTTGKD
jgi:hypothetical protein